jgi:long-chain acyl-CoA synthetase
VTAIITVNVDPKSAEEAVARAVKAANRELASFEQIRKFKVLDREFSIEQGELTPTMKLRRGRALEIHRGLVNEMYAGREFEE